MEQGLVVSNNKYDISYMTEDELDLIQQQITERKIKSLTNRIENIESSIMKFEEKVEIINDELNNKINDLQQDNDKKLEVTINTMRVDRNKWGYESQADFGNRFRVSIGSKTVGKLFKAIGLAKAEKGGTEPYRNKIGRYATTEIVKGYPTFRWHHENCLNYLENWLKDNDYLEEFYSIDKEKDMEKFIKDLYNRFVE